MTGTNRRLTCQLSGERIKSPQWMADCIARGSNRGRIGDTAMQLLCRKHLLQ